jgi:hypothetical protein
MTTVVHFDPEFAERPLCGEADRGLSFLTSAREMACCAHCEEVAVAREDRAQARWDERQPAETGSPVGRWQPSG